MSCPALLRNCPGGNTVCETERPRSLPQRQPVFHAGQLQMRLRLEQALERSRLFHGFKGFDDVPDLDVVEILEAHAAFHALGHFPGVILEAFQ